MTKKRTRDPQATRKHLLEVAFMEIFRRGFQGVSVAEIADKAGLTKGAFFHHFPTKEDLGYALVDETLRQMTIDRWIRPLEDQDDAIEAIVENFRQKIDAMSDESLTLGCPLNNLIQEMSNVDPVFRDKLRDVLEVWIAGVDKHLARSQSRGLIKPDVNTRRLAEFIVTHHEGAFGMMKALRDRRAFRSLHSSLKVCLQSVQTKGA